MQSQLRAKGDIIKRLEGKIKGFEDTKSIAVQMKIDGPNEFERSYTLEDYVDEGNRII